MLHLLDEALEALLRERVPLDTGDVDITFRSPTAEWGVGLTRPTVNLFLWGVNLSASYASAGMPLVEQEGRLGRRTPLPRIECSYLATAWTTEVRDEHQLLGAVLAVALTDTELPDDVLPDPLRSLPRPTIAMSRAETPRSAEFWSAVGGRLKPGLDLLVTATVDAGVIAGVGPPVTAHELRVRGGGASSGRRVVAGTAPATAAGKVVRSPRGVTRVGPDGRFAVPGRPGDVVIVEDQPSRAGTVPDAGPVRPE